MLLALLPWVVQHKPMNVRSRPLWMVFAPCTVLVFVALRLPTGNLWDALLDPWLWGALHVFLIRTFYLSTFRKDTHD